MIWTRKRLREVIAGFEMENEELQEHLIDVHEALDAAHSEVEHLRNENKVIIGLLFKALKND